MKLTVYQKELDQGKKLIMKYEYSEENIKAFKFEMINQGREKELQRRMRKVKLVENIEEGIKEDIEKLRREEKM